MLHDALSVVLQIGGLIAVPLVPWLVLRCIAAFERRTAIHMTDQQRAIVVGASERAAGIAYDFLASRAHGMSPEDARKAAFDEATSYVERTAEAAIDALGVPEYAVENMVRGQLGKLLASDPTVTVQPKLNPPA